MDEYNLKFELYSLNSLRMIEMMKDLTFINNLVILFIMLKQDMDPS